MNWIFLVVAGLSFFVLSQRRIRASSYWQATVTPLASIIGSGFLVIAPVLKFSMGSYALLGILMLTIFAYLIGDALRFLMQHDDLRANSPAKDTISGLTLAFAYVISVTFYIKMLAVFALKFFDIQSEYIGDILSSGIVLFIGFFGYYQGLNFLENLEKWAVNAKLSIILAFLVLLAIFDVKLLFTSEFKLDLDGHFGWDSLKVLLGALVITQGFETSLFLRRVYPKDLLIATMRQSQLISGAIYILFIALAIPLFPLITSESETAIIDLGEQVATFLPLGLIFGAQISQFSAAVADTIGAGGLGESITQGKVSARSFYLAVAIFAIALIWSTNVFEVIVLASKAFALYYMIQVYDSICLAYKLKKKPQALLYGFIFLALVLCLVIGKSVES